ncbi:MAG TPA: exosortase A [Candidatus Eisenbacteria bacterium]|nr:exosortase A [Candidatus Eisenbacteria bacterium]
MVSTAGPRRGPSLALWLLLAIFVTVVVVFHGTASSLVAIWSRTGTFGHGFVIPPIVAWLVWDRRDRLAGIAVSPRPVWIAALLLCGFAWLWGRLGGVLILEQFAFAFMIPAAIAAVLGPAMVRAIRFPLFFLMLAVPFGDWIIPQLIDFTAFCTVLGLNLTGVPVVREGPYLTVPNARWVVADACSGFRYLVASFALGTLFAYLRLRVWRNRLLLVGLSLLLPILANQFRAYMIVMLGYMSDMKIAVGVDHLLYGWVLFGALCVLLLWVGVRLAASEAKSAGAARLETESSPPGPGARVAPAPPARRLAVVSALAAGALVVWPAAAARMEAAAAAATAGPLELPLETGGWTAVEDPVAEWRPLFSGSTAELSRAYREGERVVAVYVAHYRGRERRGDLISSTNMIVSLQDSIWRWRGEAKRMLPLGRDSIEVGETRLAGLHEGRLVWHYFWLAGHHATNRVAAQMLQLRERMLRGRDDAALVVLVAPVERDPEAAARSLRDFYAAAGPEIEAALDRAAGRPRAERISLLGTTTWGDADVRHRRTR